MIKQLLTLFLIFIVNACVSKGEQNILGESGPQDITISLLKVSPPSVVIGPNETTEFQAAGGNPPYTYKVSSGFGGVTNDGVYTAPASLGNNTVQVTDAGGNSVFAVVTVGSSLQISPASKTIGTNETITLSGIGGVPPYTFAVASGLGSINAASGEYTSDATPGTVSISVTDSNSNIAYSTITVVDALTLTPAGLTIEDGTNYTFSAAGGNAPYTYQVYAGSGSINSSSGLYTAPANPGTEIIRVVDNNSNYSEATVTVVKGPNISVSTTNLAPEQTVTVSSTEGTAPFVYTVQSGSGSINSASGVYTAPAAADLSVVRVTDANGFFQEVSLQTYNLKKLAIGDNFTCMVHVHNNNTTSDFKCWGTKDYGVLGNGNTYYGDAPGEMGAALPTVDLGSGNTPIGIYSSIYYHRCALLSNGKSKCWGYGNQGRTGLGNQSNLGHYAREMGTYLPYTQLGDGYSIDTVLPVGNRISVGSEHTCVAIAANNVKCFGNGARGRSGYGNQTDRCTVNGNCGNSLPQLNLGAGKSIAQIVAGHEHSCAIIAPDNRVKCWGEANYGRLGYGNTTDRIVTPSASAWVDLGTGRTAQMLTAGFHHTCALLDDNSVKCWGRNNYGQLGIGNTQSIGDNGGEMGNAMAITDLGSVSFPVSIHSKGYHTCAIFNNGSMKCWGRNNYGQLGLENTTQKGDGAGEMGDALPFINIGAGLTVQQVDMSDRNTCVVANNGEVKCWGENNYGQLGIGSGDRIGNNAGEMGNSLAAVDLGPGKTATQVSVSIYSTCALLNDSTLKCWGESNYGNLGLERRGYGDHSGETVASLPNIDLGAGNYAKDVFAGRYHVCAILMDDTIKCFGNGGSGRLGNGSTASVGDQPNEMGASLSAVNIGTGLTVKSGDGWTNNTCVILNDDTVKCFGEGGNGRLGYGDQNDRGDNIVEMGDNLPTVNLGGGRTAKKIETGDGFTCALLDNDHVKCWGVGTSGRLGIGSTAQKGHSGATTPDTYGTVNLGTGRTAKDIKLGHQHACALLDNNQVKCWGKSNYGQLGLETNQDQGDSAAELGDNLNYVNLGTGRTAKMIATGIYHSCALLDNDKIRCWGYGYHGQLGGGISAARGDGVGEMGDNLEEVILPAGDKPRHIYASGYHTCAVMESNDVKCWGRNNAGQLGHGHNYNVGIDALSMGANLPTTN